MFLPSSHQSFNRIFYIDLFVYDPVNLFGNSISTSYFLASLCRFCSIHAFYNHPIFLIADGLPLTYHYPASSVAAVHLVQQLNPLFPTNQMFQDVPHLAPRRAISVILLSSWRLVTSPNPIPSDIPAPALLYSSVLLNSTLLIRHWCDPKCM